MITAEKKGRKKGKRDIMQRKPAKVTPKNRGMTDAEEEKGREGKGRGRGGRRR